MKKNKRYYAGKFINFIKNKFPKIYTNITNNSINKIIFTSLINYYLENKNNIVEEIKKSNKKTNTIEPEVVKE